MVEQLVQRVSGKAVIEAENGILILHPSNIDANRKWHIPGGIRDDINEPLDKTAIREVEEETKINLVGIPCNPIKIGEWTAVDKNEKVKILAVFFHFKLSTRPQIILSDEHDDYMWLDINNYHAYDTNREVYELIENLFK